MSLYAHKPTGVALSTLPPITITTSPTPPTGLERINSIEEVNDYVFGLDSHDYKVDRDVLKTFYVENGNTYTGLTANEKTILAENNIGTGSEILAQLPDRLERDEDSVDYLQRMRGIQIGVRGHRALVLEAVVWSRCKAILIDVVGDGSVMVPMPQFIFSLLNITTPSAIEMSGNLLQLYSFAGIVGMLDDGITGVLDFLDSTVGTRYETTGLTTHPLLSPTIPDGFNNVTEFRDWLRDILINGFLELGITTV